MEIKINEIKENNTDEIISAIDKYVNKLKEEMIDTNKLDIDNLEDIKEKVIELINDNNELVNSYIDNNLNNFKETLLEYKEYKMEK